MCGVSLVLRRLLDEGVASIARHWMWIWMLLQSSGMRKFSYEHKGVFDSYESCSSVSGERVKVVLRSAFGSGCGVCGLFVRGSAQRINLYPKTCHARHQVHSIHYSNHVHIANLREGLFRSLDISISHGRESNSASYGSMWRGIR